VRGRRSAWRTFWPGCGSCGCGVGAGGWLVGPGRRGVRNPSV